MPTGPFSPAYALRHLLPRYLAEWVRLAVRRPLPREQDSADASDEGRENGGPAVDEGVSTDRSVSEDESPSAQTLATPAAHRLLYVDAFARSGLHALERGPGGVVRAVDGERAVAAVRALLAAAAGEGGVHHPVDACAVLVDEDPAHLAALNAELDRAGLGHLVRRSDDASAAAPGEVLLVEGSFADQADALHDLAAAFTDSLFFLAPPAARLLPWPAFAPLASTSTVDVLLALPHAELGRLGPFADTSLADLPPQPRRVVEGFSSLLADPRHAWLAEWRRAERESGPAAAEARFVAILRDRLLSVPGERIVRSLRFSSTAGAQPKPIPRGAPEKPDVLQLFHVTGDPAHALALNGVLREMRLDDSGDDASSRRAPRLAPTEAQATVLELFAQDEMRGAGGSDGADLPVDVAALADAIAAEFRGRTVSYRHVLAWLTATDATADEARRAMALLKRTGRAAYRSIADDTAEISFPTTPTSPAARKPRHSTVDDAGTLFAPDEADSAT
jgi:hypothetical protein